MTERTAIVAAGALLLLAAAGCGTADAQEKPAALWEHGVFEWIQHRGAKEEEERISWITAAEEIQRDSVPAFFSALGITASLDRSPADRLRVIDSLSAAGWEVLNRTDVAFADAGGSAIAERYVLRRRR
jgi:hypothetical protein